jgi:hypothetical protein
MDPTVRNDAVAGLLILIIVGIFASVTGIIFVDPMDPGFSARDFPIGVLSLLTILGLVLFGRSVRALARTGWRLTESGEFDAFIRHLVPIVALGFLYVWCIEMFPYPLPTFAALSAALALYGNRGAVRLIVVPFVVTILFYVLFYGVLGLSESLGTVLSYENEPYFRPLRDFIGLF